MSRATVLLSRPVIASGDPDLVRQDVQDALAHGRVGPPAPQSSGLERRGRPEKYRRYAWTEDERRWYQLSRVRQDGWLVLDAFGRPSRMVEP